MFNIFGVCYTRHLYKIKKSLCRIKATVENNSQMYKLKLHTLWSPVKKDVYIGIIGYFDTSKTEEMKKETQRRIHIEKEKWNSSFGCVFWRW